MRGVPDNASMLTRISLRSIRATASKLPPDQDVVERVDAAAMDEEKQRRRSPQQRVFQPERVPEEAADPPALHIRHREKNDDRHRRGPCEQSKREQRPAYELG